MLSLFPRTSHSNHSSEHSMHNYRIYISPEQTQTAVMKFFSDIWQRFGVLFSRTRTRIIIRIVLRFLGKCQLRKYTNVKWQTWAVRTYKRRLCVYVELIKILWHYYIRYIILYTRRCTVEWKCSINDIIPQVVWHFINRVLTKTVQTQQQNMRVFIRFCFLSLYCHAMYPYWNSTIIIEWKTAETDRRHTFKRVHQCIYRHVSYRPAKVLNTLCDLSFSGNPFVSDRY